MHAIACVKCGKRLPPGHRFCGYCGSSSSNASDNREVVPETQFFEAAAVESKARLIVLRGEGGDGASFRLNAAEHICGRSQGTVLFPDDPTVSPQHACFYYRDGGLYCRDLGSVNGTFIRLRSRIPLAHGDRFICGEQLFEFNTFPRTIDEQWTRGTCFAATPQLWPWTFQLTQILTRGRAGAIRSSSQGSLTVGREDCDFAFAADSFLSQYHARVVRVGDQCFLEDTESRNGTFYKVRNAVGLKDEDNLFVGRQLLRVEIV